jgi:hypothetical protein
VARQLQARQIGLVAMLSGLGPPAGAPWGAPADVPCDQNYGAVRTGGLRTREPWLSLRDMCPEHLLGLV